jgi:hypothetical protein
MISKSQTPIDPACSALDGFKKKRNDFKKEKGKDKEPSPSGVHVKI